MNVCQRNILRSVGLFFLSFLVISCDLLRTKSERGLDKKALVFTLDPFQKNGLQGTGTFSISPTTGEGFLVLSVKNISSDLVSIETDLITVKSDMGYQNLPYKSSVPKLILKKGLSETVKLNYSIVNNPRLYQRYGLAGDIQNRYWINLNFTINNDKTYIVSETIQCMLPEDIYKNYLKEFGIEQNLATYETRMSNTAFSQQQKQYLKQHQLLVKTHDAHEEIQNGFDPEPFILLSGDEIVLHQVVCKFSPYKIRDTYYLSIKLINKSIDPIQIDSSKFKILVGTFTQNTENKNEIWQSEPFDFTNKKQNLSQLNDLTAKEILVLNQNDRVTITLSFKKTNNVETDNTSIALVTEGLTIYRHAIPLIGMPLLYEKQVPLY